MREGRIFRAAVYARISVEDEGEGSVESQAAIGREYIQAHKDMRLYRIYRDVGRTGMNFKRPAFEAMLKDARAGRVDCVIVKDLSRLGRNYIETDRYMEHVFPFLGLRLIAVNDGYDSMREAGAGEMLAVGLKNLVNELYARDIGERVRLAKRLKREAGSYVGGSPPYGFRLIRQEGKRLLAPDPETAGCVGWMFERAALGWPAGEICRELKRQGARAPGARRGAGWRPETVRRMLKNPLYAGLGAGVPAPLVRREVWEQVQAGRQERAAGSRKKTENLPGSGGPLEGPGEKEELSGLLETAEGIQRFLLKGWGWSPLGEGWARELEAREEKRRRLAGRAAMLYAMGREEELRQVRRSLRDWEWQGSGCIKMGPGRRVVIAYGRKRPFERFGG